MKNKLTHSVWYLIVHGTGSFPIDMLRYDSCAPRARGGLTRDDRGEAIEALRRREAAVLQARAATAQNARA